MIVKAPVPKKIEPIAAPGFLQTPDNKAPPNGRLLQLKTRDGVGIRAAFWPAAREPASGTVLVLQGRAEFIEKYFEVVEELTDRGFAVATFDWRGQGRSGREVRDGRKGHIRHFDDFRHDLDAVRDQLLTPFAPGPLYVLGHSMGGCIALIGAAENWLPADRIVVTTPMIALSIVRHPRLARLLARLLHAIGLGERFVPGGRPHSISTEPFEGNRLSRDERRYARNAAIAGLMGEGAIGSPTVGWIRAAYEAMRRFEAPAYASRIRVPTLVVAAGDDPVCSTAVSEAFARKLGAGSAALVIPKARHEVLMESDAIRSQFWAAFDSFVPGPTNASSAAQSREHDLVEPLVPASDD